MDVDIVLLFIDIRQSDCVDWVLAMRARMSLPRQGFQKRLVSTYILYFDTSLIFIFHS